jgi:sirohydrochlorin cobaltochelatase
MADRSPTQSTDGILLVGHGTREERGVREMLSVARLTAERLPGVAVEPCFLELANPMIADGVERLVALGVRRMTVMPLLLFAAGHAKRDIPRAARKTAARHPDLTVHMALPLGCHDKLVELSARRYQEAIDGHERVPDARTLLLMVGRGSHDPEANSDMARFTRLRWERTPVGWHETCYMAMTRPTLGDALPVVARMGFKRVVVQPHLLFEGELAGRVRRDTNQFAQGHPETEWIVTGHLGPHELLIGAIVDRAGEAARSFNPEPSATA